MDALQAFARQMQQPSDPGSHDRKYLLDSAAHPTHINHPTAHMQRLSAPLTTHTATSTSRSATNQATLTIRTAKGNTIKLPAIYNPQLRHDLLSAHDLAKRYGAVLFTPSTGYVFDTHGQPRAL